MPNANAGSPLDPDFGLSGAILLRTQSSRGSFPESSVSPDSDHLRYLENCMKLISVNVGLPREVEWHGQPVTTGIFKEPVEGAVTIRRINLDGDRQADLTVHGGPEKAVYGYPSEHYEYWRGELPDQTFPWGKFGENLTTEGLLEEALYIGDRLKVGSAVLTVTQPRLPCYKLALRFNRDDMIKRFLSSQRSGFYFSVNEEGEVQADSGHPDSNQAGSTIEFLTRDPHQVSITDISRLYFSKTLDSGLLHRALQVEALPQSWKDYLQTRAAARA